MIGIVIVSHSRKLSDGLKELADAMSQAPVPIASAGGIDDLEEPLGTDAVRVLEAIREIGNGTAVLIFADIGSARLNAEMAIDLLEPDERARTHFCDAPLVEGVLAAAVQIAAGSDLQTVLREAKAAAQVVGEAAGSKEPEGLAREFTIRNRLGLHARPAAKFVQAMNAFAGDIRLVNVTKGKPAANAKSINGVMLSEVSAHDTIRMVAPPPEASAVFAAVEELIATNFGEDELAPMPRTSASVPQDRTITSGILKGIPISKGYALGSIRHISRALPEIAARQTADPEAEIARFEAALADAETELRQLLEAEDNRFSSYDRKIFEAHVEVLRDPEMYERVLKSVRARRICAEAVWRDVVAETSQTYAALSDPLLRARGEDVIDVGLRVLHLLTGTPSETHAGQGEVVLAFDDLRPSDVLTLNADNVVGLCTVFGGKTSHAGILASSLKIPVVFAVGRDLAAVAENAEVMVDGTNGIVTVAPEREAIVQMETAQFAWERRLAAAEAVKKLSAVTADGHAVRVAANMASPDELGAIASSGADEIGLFRTEFLFMRRSAAPDEEEQYALYRRIVQGLGGLPLTARTMDIGGDKQVAYMDRPPEANPNLGWRGLRYSLDVPELLDTQLSALLRASAHGPVRIMFPLVSSLDEFRAARHRLDRIKERLDREGAAFDKNVEVGIMVEVPAAALTADVLAPEVDFFSIGTNDLTQYVLAADRANPKVQNLFDPFHPAVLRLIDRTIRAGRDSGIWTGMCGAMAGNPLAAPVLTGLGLDEFSMNPRDIPEFKLIYRDLSLADCRALADDVLRLPSAGAVRDAIQSFLDGHSVEDSGFVGHESGESDRIGRD